MGTLGAAAMAVVSLTIAAEIGAHGNAATALSVMASTPEANVQSETAKLLASVPSSGTVDAVMYKLKNKAILEGLVAAIKKRGVVVRVLADATERVLLFKLTR
jgi:hypothetical protein